eukprot:gnl/TRDRNA2_/TRDRNA2_126770_c0_seq1.p1 gnl/TRDRNA2_/TRDRNA2_126770_c0~~gnl/TRDRNA2_/TRDRNA2_126770_c0_seq1.p1  ORF type:complete len:327 (+),score=61.52 gnl/TRDRNA2_/TRDRNA2_126770_c0_seq1:123-983(+)
MMTMPVDQAQSFWQRIRRKTKSTLRLNLGVDVYKTNDVEVQAWDWNTQPTSPKSVYANRNSTGLRRALSMKDCAPGSKPTRKSSVLLVGAGNGLTGRAPPPRPEREVYEMGGPKPMDDEGKEEVALAQELLEACNYVACLGEDGISPRISIASPRPGSPKGEASPRASTKGKAKAKARTGSTPRKSASSKSAGSEPGSPKSARKSEKGDASARKSTSAEPGSPKMEKKKSIKPGDGDASARKSTKGDGDASPKKGDSSARKSTKADGGEPASPKAKKTTTTKSDKG